MLTRLIRAAAPRQPDASGLAARLFPACHAHQRETTAVYLAIGQLVSMPQTCCGLDVTIAEVLGDRTSPTRASSDSLEAIERQLALEEELGDRDLVKLALIQVADENLMKRLLGPAVDTSHWDAATIWVRSIRGVINERVRHSGDCKCGDTPSNNKMQLTRSGHLDGGPRS